jgi:hypothetical protein
MAGVAARGVAALVGAVVGTPVGATVAVGSAVGPGTAVAVAGARVGGCGWVGVTGIATASVGVAVAVAGCSPGDGVNATMGVGSAVSGARPQATPSRPAITSAIRRYVLTGLPSRQTADGSRTIAHARPVVARMPRPVLLV